MLITDRESIDNAFYSTFQKIYSRQDVDDSSEAIQEFLDSDGDTKPSEYLNSKVLKEGESNCIEGEITPSKLQHTLFYKMNGSVLQRSMD